MESGCTTKKRKRRQAIYGSLYILPAFLVITLFCIVTIFMTFYFSMTDYNMYSPPEFIGLQNYASIMNSKVFYTALINTFQYVIVTVPFQVVLSLTIAAFLAEKVQNAYGEFLRSAMFIPVIVSAIAASAVWKVIFKNDGILNSVIQWFGLHGLNWMGDKHLAFLCVCIVSIWKNVGYFLVIYYAGIQGVSRELHEAAITDGASTLQRFWYITVPSVKPITYMVITLSIIWSFQIFDVVYQLTNGGPGTATTTLAYVIYQHAFQNQRLGYASALAVLLLLFVLLIHIIQDMFFKEKKEGR